MSNVTSTDPVMKNDTEYEAIADQLLADMQRLNELMKSDRVEIDQLKTETRLLREVAAHLETENRAALSRLKAVFA
ncbi:MAG TPA: hypothetical protein VKU00_08795 [Chthonomonadaceae bacterium]|nr:hypothetical protein [Chthonomonadaceae bacterium]